MNEKIDLTKILKETLSESISALKNTWGEGEFVPLEDSGVSFDRYNEGKNIVYIGW